MSKKTLFLICFTLVIFFLLTSCNKTAGKATTQTPTCDVCFKGKCDGNCNPKKEGLDCLDCVTAVCGNNITEAGEECDGPDLAGKTCQDYGYNSGTLKCTSSCRWDSSTCYNSGEYCGNGYCAGSGEDCNSCPQDCPKETSSSCGDGICNAGEDCNSCSIDCTSGTIPPTGTCSACFKGKCDSSCNSRKEGPDCADCNQETNYCCGQDFFDSAYCGNNSGYAGEIISCCGDSVCEGIETAQNCGADCPLQASLTLATLKASYQVGEQIKLTDPPDNVMMQQGIQGTMISLHEYVEGELIVKYKENPLVKKYASLDKLNQKFKVHGQEELFKKIKERTFRNEKGQIKNNKDIYKLKIEKGKEREAAWEFSSDPNVEYAEPNNIYSLSFIPNDARYSEQWSHQITQAELGWDIEQGDPNIVIAIIDTGVDWQHEDLADNIWINTGEIAGNGIDDDSNNYTDDVRGWDFTDTTRQDYCTSDCLEEDNDPSDEYGHGTHVAGIAAATTNNNIGIAGVCPNCKIMALRTAGLSDVEISGALYYAADNGARIISMSIGGLSSQTVQDAIDYAYSRNITLIASAGNSNMDFEQYPAAYENVIAVTATNSQDRKAFFSNYGYWTDVAAPGDSILSTIPSDYMSASGTSMSAPYVAGLAGLILSKNSALSQKQLREILKQGVDPFDSTKYLGTGRVNVYKALQIDSVSNAIAEIISPQNDEIIPYSHITVIGTATGDKYTVYYGEGIYPNSLIQIGSGLTANNEIIAEFDLQNTNPKFYTIKLVVEDINGIVEDRVSINNINYTQGQDLLMPGWPIGTGWLQYSVPTIGDIDASNDGQEVIITADSLGEGYVQVFNYDGSVVSGFPYIEDTGFSSKPALADLDGDGDLDIIIGSIGGWRKGIYAIDNTGELMDGWPFYYEDLGQYMDFAPAISDLDNDGEYEIITCIWQPDHLIVLNSNGSMFFDLDVPCVSKLVGNFDNDTEKEIVILDRTNKLNLINVDGSLTNIIELDLVGGGQIIAGDIERNGKNEIVVLETGSTDVLPKIYVVRTDGSLPTGWPQQLQSALPQGVALGDLDDDKQLEIVVSDWYLVYAFNHDGSYLEGNWPINVYEIYAEGGRLSSPTIVDVNDDGQGDIIVVSDSGNIYAFSSSGEQIDGFPITGSIDFSQFGPTFGDVDNDGELEVALNSVMGGKTYVYELPGHPGYNEETMDWPMYRYDNQNTGCYKCDKLNPLPPACIEFVDILTASWHASCGDSNYDARVDIAGANFTGGADCFIDVWDLMVFGDHSFDEDWCAEKLIGLPQSKIVNNGNYDLIGQLTMILQKNVNENWIDVQVVVNKQVVVSADDLLKLDNEWNPNNVAASGTGNYRIYVRFEAYGQGIENSWEFVVS